MLFSFIRQLQYRQATIELLESAILYRRNNELLKRIKKLSKERLHQLQLQPFRSGKKWMYDFSPSRDSSWEKCLFIVSGVARVISLG